MKNVHRLLAGILGAALVVAGVAGVAAQQTMKINGAGATFPTPIYSKWFDEYHKQHPNIEINYASIGSGGGIRQVTNQTVFFGASDGPMTKDQLLAAPSSILHFPTVLGGVVPVYNIPGVSAELKFTGPVLADIYLGKITKWNDPAIVKLNPGVKLSDSDITVVHRSDGSGTTFIWVNYLSKVSPEWKEKVGEGTSVAWPTGVGGKGNEGVASYVQRVKGSIGYVEYAYALQNKMTYAQVQNRDGNFVGPSSETFKAAAAGADWTKAPGYYLMLTDQPGKNAWPISGATFILMYKTQPKPDTAKEVLKFFDWAYSPDGDKLADALDYVPLPDAVTSQIKSTWKTQIKDTSGKPVY